MMKLHVLYVDDLLPMLKGVKHALQTSTSAKSATGESVTFSVEIFSKASDYSARQSDPTQQIPDLVLLDIVLDNVENAGLMLATKTRKLWKDTVIVMFSQFDDADTIVEYMAVGADNFLSKETKVENLPANIIECYELARRKMRVSESESLSFEHPRNIAGSTMRAISERVPGLLRSAVRAIHVYGETGTGKEIVADVFEHWMGSKAPFIRVNCGAISPSLLESELFGHAKGSFTGATTDKIGLLESASSGWLFLDEVALLSPSAQRALLRAIENQEITRIGETKSRKVNVKIISATNENLELKSKEGQFRQDLYQRLKEIELFLPPLRERNEEVEELINHFCSNMEGGPYQLLPTTIDVLKRYSWDKGNIRELRNCLRAMTEFSSKQVLSPAAIPRSIFQAIAASSIGTSTGVGGGVGGGGGTVTNKQQKKIMETDIKIELDLTKDLVYEDLENHLLAQLVTIVCQNFSINSLRTLESKIFYSRVTLTKRLRILIQKGILNPKSLSPELLKSLANLKSRNQKG